MTLVNAFKRLEVDAFPSPPVPFSVYTALTDGLGEVMLSLVVSRCDTLEDIYIRSFKVTFKNPLEQLRLYWQVRSCSFPEPGNYQFGLQADDEPITQNVIKVIEKGPNHA